MRPVEINSVVETYNDRVIVKDYVTRNYDDGTKVRDVVITSYAVTLYGNNGQLQDHTSKGHLFNIVV